MKIYLDLIFFINFFYDFLLLLTVGMALKRKKPIIRYLLAAFLGAMSVFSLFLPFNNYWLTLFKIIVSILMCLIAFGYVSIRYLINNLAYLYMCSVILAGFLYFLNNQVAVERRGLFFIHQGFSVNYVVLIIIAPVILFCYLKSSKKIDKTYNYYYHLEIVFDELKINCLSFLDSGNALKDPITGKAVIIVNKKVLKDVYHIRSPIYVPYKTISGNSIMPCYKPSYILINNQKIDNYLIGESDYNFKDGVNAILNSKLKEDHYV